MLGYFKVSEKKNEKQVKKMKKKRGIITDNSKKGSIIVKRVIPEVQIGVGIEEMNEVGIGEMNKVGIGEMKGHHKTLSLSVSH